MHPDDEDLVFITLELINIHVTLVGLSVGRSVEIWSEKFRSSWPAKLEFSLKPLSNPSVSEPLSSAS